MYLLHLLIMQTQKAPFSFHLPHILESPIYQSNFQTIFTVGGLSLQLTIGDQVPLNMDHYWDCILYHGLYEA
jgi:hypothetical protein